MWTKIKVRLNFTFLVSSTSPPLSFLQINFEKYENEMKNLLTKNENIQYSLAARCGYNYVM